MKPFDELTPRQQFFRKNAFRLVIYGAFVLVLIWSIIQMVAVQDEQNAQYNRIEDTMMDFYRETRDQGDTLGMSQYMQERLSPDDYKAWQRQAK